MFMTLKRIEALREDELGQVTTPFYALGALKDARLGYSRIQGFDAAWEGCIDSHGPWDWNHRARGFERLRTRIEQGEWVLVLDRSWPPISPAYRQVDGQWEVTRAVWETTPRHRLESRTQTILREQREQKAFQSQNHPSSATEPHTESAHGPGNRPATLGPQAGLHDQDWDAVDVKRDSFKTVRKVDMEKLSVVDATARKALKGQGWDGDKIEKVLNSGDHFTTKELNLGDKLYGFGTQGREKNIQNSAYWLDDAGFKDVQSRFYKNGQWDKEGVKNYLALPCANRATAIHTVEVTKPTTAVTANIVKAREVVQYTDTSGYTTGMLGKIMPGGGTQITANPSVLAAL